jgi:CIC family chloride channel protein
MNTEVPSLRADQPLTSAIELFDSSGEWVLPIVDGDGAYIGTISKSTLFDRYRSELIVQTASRQE